MNRKSNMMFLVAFVIASFSTLLVWRLVVARAASGTNPRVTAIVAAARNIKIGTVLTSADIQSIAILGSLPEGAIRDSKALIGRGVVADLYTGEPILENRLAAVGSGGGLAATIPLGMRVCAVKVDEVVGVAGFATPGMRVDVLVSGTPPGMATGANGPEVRTLLQNIEVKSAGTDIEKDAQGKPQQVQVVNLLVTPEQAESLSLASGQTRIQLVLRNPLDTQLAPLHGNSMADVFTGAQAKAKPVVFHREPKKVAASAYTIDVLDGSKGSATRVAVAEERP